MLRAVGFVREENAATLWFIGCAVGGHVFIAIGARAAGLALLGAVVGSFIGLLVVASNFNQLPQGAMVGASVGTFIAGLAGLAWKSWASPSVLCVLGSATIFVGVVAGWAAYLQACDGYGQKRCFAEVDAGSLALFALDAAWVAALCFIQAAQSNRAPSRTVEAYENPEVPAS